MNEQTDNRLAYLCGFVGALWQWYLNIHLPVDFASKLLEGAITAGLCGFAGMAGKWLFGIVKLHVIKPMIKYFKERKNKNDVGKYK